MDIWQTTGNQNAWQRLFLLHLLGTLPHYRPGLFLDAEV